ncbi:MAG: dTDP-4-dehydrorhamnose 3,5-epimerase [Weeksellaceae bacterium]|nr:dTDP-4-dehydrorhamnose 3,5-epimerase [Weeksellaceae bacterium]
MKIEKTAIQDCFIIEPSVFEDARGYFFESFNLAKFSESSGLQVDFVQDNQSLSSYGVVRGMHAQIGDYAQAKLVRVLQGEVLDVAVDFRRNSPSFGKKVEVLLSESNRRQLFIPRGCLHGFSVLSESAVFFYKCDNYYNKIAEVGVNPLDLDLQIDWRVPEHKILLSDKDINASTWQDFNETSNKLTS